MNEHLTNDPTNLDAHRYLAPDEFRNVKAQLLDHVTREWVGHGAFRVHLWEQEGLDPLDPETHPSPEAARNVLAVFRALEKRFGRRFEVRVRTFLPLREGDGGVPLEERVIEPVRAFRSYLLFENDTPVLDEPHLDVLMRRACMRMPAPQLLVLDHRPYLTPFFPPEEDEGIDEDAPYAFDVEADPPPPVRAGTVANRGFLEQHNRFLATDLFELGYVLADPNSIDWYATLTPEGREHFVKVLVNDLRDNPASTVQHRAFLEKLLEPAGVSLVGLQLDLLT